MSAIAGLLQLRNGPAPPGWINRLTAAMQSMGPDATSHWTAGSVALGHCLLATTPEAVGEIQPLTTEDGAIAITFDGRLDNRAELQHDLILRGWQLRRQTDTELVLRAWQQWGEDSPTHLLGDFAYAVWDTRSHVLFCARDHLGARPFYYAKTADFVAFASSEEALTGIPGISREPNEERIAELLAPGVLQEISRQGWLRDVCALLPGECASFTPDGRQKLRTYWEPVPGDRPAFDSDAQCQEAFAAVFGEAVRARLRLNGEPAALLSGGMDSAGMAAMVQRLLGQAPGTRLHTYSVVADDLSSCIESRCIQSMTRAAHVRPCFVSVPSLQGALCASDLMNIVWTGVHPVDSSIVLVAALCQIASRDGHRVLLHGVSGDITLGTPERYPAQLMRSGHWQQAWAECQLASRHHTYLGGTPAAKLLALNAWTAFAPLALKQRVWQRRNARQQYPAWTHELQPDFDESVGWSRRWRAQREQPAARVPAASEELAQAVFRNPGLVSGLTGYGRVGARFGVEMRDPWADRRVVEFFLALPLTHKVRNGWTKHLARATFAADLGGEVTWRSGKEHLGWTMLCPVMDQNHQLIRQALQRNEHLLSRYLRLQHLHTTWQDYERNKADEDRLRVYEYTTLALWLERLHHPEHRL